MMPTFKMNFLSSASLLASLSLCTLFLVTETQAQDQNEVHLQFLSFPKAANSQEVELYLGEGESLKVEIPTNRISKNYVVKPMDRWTLGESIKDEEEKTVFKPFGQAPAINSNKQLILVIRKGRENEDGLILIPMPNTERDFGGGTFFFMNATPLDIAGILSDKKFALKPGKFTLVKPSPSEVKGTYKYCKTELIYRKDGDVRSFFNSNWRLNDKARSLIFIYQDPKSKHIRLHSIRDYL